ncbi:sulfotransferase [Tamlana flava]|uniref:sulfotransferase n=1 Tax=Tamlana flava TaxID=3158572 RepID=UPI00351AE220
MLFKNSKEKIFCIGLNKTGTTSLGVFFEQEDYKVAKQRDGELLLKNYIERDFASIIKFVEKSHANVYQDVPFSLPYTFPHLDNAFPNSKFILTVRNNSEDWYNSIFKFHSNFYNKGSKPSYESLLNAEYVYKGWSWNLMNNVFIKDKCSLYDKNEFIGVYENHIKMVSDYFKNKPEKLIAVNLSRNEDFQKLCAFLKINTTKKNFPEITSGDILSQNFKCDFL